MELLYCCLRQHEREAEEQYATWYGMPVVHRTVQSSHQTIASSMFIPLYIACSASMRDLDEVESLEAALSLLEGFEPLEGGGLELNDPFGFQNPPLALDMMPAGGSAFSNSDVYVFGAASAVAADNAPLLLPPSRQRPAASRALAQKKRRPRTVDFNPNRARDERKEELVYLRAKVVEMEKQLSQLKTTDHGATHPEHGLLHAIPDSKASSLLLARNYFQPSPSSCMWEEIATRQFGERRKAEMENIRLKLLLEGQIKVAKGLERMLNKRSNTQVGYSLCCTGHLCILMLPLGCRYLSFMATEEFRKGHETTCLVMKRRWTMQLSSRPCCLISNALRFTSMRSLKRTD